MATRNGRMRLTLIGLLAFMAGFNEARASHAMAMDINYEHIAGETYRITLNFYRDCDGTTAPGSIPLRVSSAFCGMSQTVSLALDTFFEVSQLCPAELPNSTCASPLGTLPGTQKYVYSALYTFPAKCSDWVLSYELCCRNAAITNLVTPSSWSQYVYTTLNNTGTINNNSPFFGAIPTPYVCVNTPMTFNPGSVDPDGDSLVFSLAQPMDAAGVYIPYVSPYTTNYPMSTSSGTVTFDPTTGQISCTPNALQVAVIAIKVEEYRNGVLIGTMQRDFQIVVISCDNEQPVISSINSVSGSSAIQADTVTVEMCAGTSMCFTFTASDPNSTQNLTVTANNSLTLPGSTLNTSGTNPVSATICWSAPPDTFGSTHYVVVKVEDDTCPTNAVVYKTFVVQVIPGTYAGTDEYSCGDSVQLQATGGTSFTWAPPTGLSCTNCPNPKALPSSTTTYTVTSNLATGCDTTDDVTVFVVPQFTMDAGPTDTICRGEGVFLNPTYQSGSYVFSWSPPGSLTNPTIPNPLAYPGSTTTYTLTMTNSVTQCVMNDTVRIVVQGAAPAIFPYAEDDSICQGQSTQLDLLLGCGGDCSSFYGGCTGAQVGTVGTATTSFTISEYPAVFGKWQGKTHNQILYRREELLATGISAGGRISSIAFETSQTAGAPIYQQFTVKMKCTNLDELGSPVPDYTGFTTVFTPKTYNVTLGWNTITFDSLYEWDGLSNIMIDVCFSNPANINFNDPTYYTATSYNSVRYVSSGTCGVTYNHTLTNKRPNTRFTLCCDTTGYSDFIYTWLPSTGLSNANIKNPIANPTTNTTYTVIASDTASSCSTFGIITITVSPDFTLSSSPDDTICRGGSIQLNTTPSVPSTEYTYTWSPNYQLSSPYVKNPIASPFVTTSYAVDVNRNGCHHYDTITITVVKGIGLLETAPQDTTICKDAPVQLFAKVGGIPVACDTNAAGCGPNAPEATVKIGSGGTVNSVFQNASDGRAQHIVLAEDLWGRGFYGGTITELAIYVVFDQPNPILPNFTIRMGCTTLDNFPTPTVWFTGMKQVYSNIPGIVTSGGWNVFALSPGYDWDGNSNLVVEMCYDASTIMVGNESVMGTYTSQYRSLITSSTVPTSSGCSLSAPSVTCAPNSGSCYAFCPDFRFKVCSAPDGPYTYAWSPPTYLTNTTIWNPIATPPGSFTYSVTVSDGACTIEGKDLTVTVDSFGLIVWPDTTLCPPDTVHLHSAIGYIPTMKLDCGANGTACGVGGGFHQFGSGTTSIQGGSPFLGGWQIGNTNAFGRSQYIITRDELNAAGRLYDGIVTQVEVECDVSNGATFEGLTIKMLCTSEDEFSCDAFIEGGTIVKTISGTYTPTTGWNVFVLDAPFDWDGVSNLIVEFCYLQGNPSTQNVMATNVGKNRTTYLFNLVNGCAVPSTYYSADCTTFRPNFSLGICNPPTSPVTYSWSPGATLDDSTSANPVASPTDTTTYTLTAWAGECEVQKSVTLNVCEVLLPITWLTFTAWPHDNDVQLEWSVQWENSDHFVIERREPGGTFKRIGEVTAVNNRSRYQFIDTEPFKPTNYYRIRHVDHSGGYDYSVIRMVEFFGQELSATLMPNPLSADRDLTLRISGLTRETEVQMEVLNAVGAVVTRRHLTLSPDYPSVVLEGTLFTAGAVYLVNTEADGQVIHLKLVRQ